MWYNFIGLFLKEMRRFTMVYNQTVIAPVVNGALLLIVFSVATTRGYNMSLGKMQNIVAFKGFLAAGISGMIMIQNGIANTSTSLVSAKVIGYINDFIVPPFLPHTFVVAMTLVSCIRSIVIMILFCTVSWLLNMMHIHSICYIFMFSILISAISSMIGLLIGFYANTFDQMSAITNYAIAPPVLLSGVFFSVTSLSPIWKQIMMINPFFFMIDGLRYGFIGIAENNINLEVFALTLFACVLYYSCVKLFKHGSLISQ